MEGKVFIDHYCQQLQKNKHLIGLLAPGAKELVPPWSTLEIDTSIPPPSIPFSLMGMRKPEPPPRVFTTLWAGRTPAKTAHRAKAIDAIQEIVDDTLDMENERAGKPTTKRQRAKKIGENPVRALLDNNFTVKSESDKDDKANGENGPVTRNKSTSPMPNKRSTLYCTICQKVGHTTRVCYHNQTNTGKDVLRCYNCGKIGHLAVRCAYPPNNSSSATTSRETVKDDSTKTKSKKRRAGGGKLAAQRRKAAASAEAEKNDSTGIELICKILADRPLREETQRSNPGLYDDMLTLMLDSITI